MGVCSSCCRSEESPEREPLLPRSGHRDRDETATRHTDKVADIVGALEAGRLPSQAQIDHAFRGLLSSDLLKVEDTDGHLPPSLRKELVVILNDVNDVVAAMLEEEIADDKLQELLFLTKRVSTESAKAFVAVDAMGGPSSVPQEVQEAIEHLPSVPEVQEDVGELAEAVKDLAQLTIFSSTFRFILRDIFTSMRAILAQGIAAVGEVASEIQIAANMVEPLIDPKNALSTTLDQQLSTVVGEAASSTVQVMSLVGDKVTDQTKNIVINRIQETMIRAHSSPKYKSALRTILVLLQKYSERVSEVVSPATVDVTGVEQAEIRLEPKFWTDESLSIVLADVKILLERFASGNSLDPLIRTLRACVQDLVSSLAGSGLTEYFADFGSWVDQSLNDPKYSVSRAGHQKVDDLYERGHTLFSEDTEFGQDIRSLFRLAEDFLHGISQDRTTNWVIGAMDKLSADSANLFQEQPYRVGRELRRDLFFWLLPRFLRIIRNLPMPRVEYINDGVEVALDSIVLNSSTTLRSLMPDSIHIINHNDLHITQHDDPYCKNFVRVRVEGLRMAIQDLEYYLQYKGLIGYEDEGFISIDVGDDRGQGLSFDIDLEFNTDIDPTKVDYGFKVLKVHTAVSGLRFSINESKHWILNKVLLQHLAGPVVRKTFEHVASGCIRDGLEAISRIAAEIERGAAETVAPGLRPDFNHYWSAALKCLHFLSQHHSPHPGESPEYAPEVTTRTEATLRGIVRTTETEPVSNGDAAEESEVTTMAVGVTPQILPGKAVTSASRTDELAHEARNVIEEVESTIEQTRKTAEEFAESVPDELEARAVYGNTMRRVSERKNVKITGHNDGWRSDTFNLW
ncbi:hypothetical protein BDM02DRAFT_3184891 [Thelephora ganbajun]|uniref:Uncharacterized protein n=1 Tax=Thelephora ganbajun TaxID=370292 RepID=A0ACB6ZNN8_THEGA|nr:hypothetical protein BDM02DRAFT_3184891 [Thelephora ganbajun]